MKTTSWYRDEFGSYRNRHIPGVIEKHVGYSSKSKNNWCIVGGRQITRRLHPTLQSAKDHVSGQYEHMPTNAIG